VHFQVWGRDPDPQALEQMTAACRLPVATQGALMPDAHVGYGMPIGGVIACDNAVIPNAVGVDIGCGMGAVQTNLPRAAFGEKRRIRALLDAVKARVPVGEGHSHGAPQAWEGFDRFEAEDDLVEAVVRLRPLGVVKG
jgi:tRNA-splicing ligase RtcB